MESAPVQLAHVDHYFGAGDLRKQILFDLTTEIRAGEIVIVTGPSGSGKTTALTLMGALRSAQAGSVVVLERELREAPARTLVEVRRKVGYIFQHHNLLESLTAGQNVQMGLALQDGLSKKQLRRRAGEVLEAVGLGDRIDSLPDQLSGGQKQRVAIARALAGSPRIILADEPTASLDRASGRDAVALIERLCRQQGATALLVTHDNRILDVADRILHLEDGRLTSFGDAVLSNTRHLMNLLAQQVRKGHLREQVADLPPARFAELLDGVTGEARNFLRVSELARGGAFESMLDQALDAFAFKIGELLDADRASLWLLDEERGELWSKVARDAAGQGFEIRIPRGAGVVGAVVASGSALNLPDAQADPRFDSTADHASGYRTRSILCVPLSDQKGRVFGAAQILNRRDGEPFDADDETRFREFTASMEVILESWWQMSRGRTPNGPEP